MKKGIKVDPTYINGLEFIFQSPVSNKAKGDDVVRRAFAQAYRNRSVFIYGFQFPLGDKLVRQFIRDTVVETLKKHIRKNEEFFYVIARFREKRQAYFFRTIIPRQTIPLQLRGLRYRDRI